MAWATVGRVEFSVLGPVRGWHDGQSVALGGRQRRCVLTVLLLRADQVTPLERLVALVWGEHPPAAVHNAVQTHVSRLRKALAFDPGVGIDAVPSGYVLRLPPERVDLHRFRRLVAEAGEAGHPGRSGELLAEALALWQGRAAAQRDVPRVSSRGSDRRPCRRCPGRRPGVRPAEVVDASPRYGV